MQERIRNCTNPVPDNGGKDCSRLGADSQTRKCNAMPCPGDYPLYSQLVFWFLWDSGQVTNLSIDGNKNENTLFYSSQLMEASQSGHLLPNVQRLVVVARSFGLEIVAILLRSLVASHVTILEGTKSRENVTRCSARVCISVKNTFDFDFH